jgi:hypothetical protein
MAQEQVDFGLAEVGRESKRTYDSSLARLHSLILQTDPIKLLSNLAVYGSFHSEGSEPELEETHPHLQLHFELMQAFVLMHDMAEYAPAVVVQPTLVQEVVDLVKQVADSLGLKGLAVASTPKTDLERARLFSQASVRLHTIAVRNAGYVSQLRRLHRELTTPLDDAIEAETGLKLTLLLEFLWNVNELIERRVNEDHRKMASVFEATKIEDAVSAYYSEYPGLIGDPRLTVALLRRQGATLENAKVFLLFHRELSFPHYFTLSWDDLVSCYPESVSVEKLRQAMDCWSLSFGQLAGRDPDHFFLDNPVWTQPFIRLEDDSYFCPVSGVLWSFALRLIEEFVSTRTTLTERYEKRRDKFLEAQVELLVRKAFPSAQVFAGSNWTDSVLNRNGENDCLVVLGDIALVFECKAGRISDKALRALPDRLTRTLKDLAAKPADQARNFIALLERDPRLHNFVGNHGAVNRVDVSGVRRFVPISVTWETFGAFRLRWPVLQSAGFIPSEAKPTVTLSLADLEVVLDILDSELRRLHYFVQRSDLEFNESVISDEIDLLAHYLDAGFKGADLAIAQDQWVDLSMQSKRIDPVFEANPSDRPLTWPGTRLSPLWQSLLNDLSTRRPEGWVYASLLLMEVPYSVQVQVGHMLEDVAKKAKRAPTARAQKQDRRNFRPSQLALVAMAFKGFAMDELLGRSRDASNLKSPPFSIPICLRVEGGSTPFVGI